MLKQHSTRGFTFNRTTLLLLGLVSANATAAEAVLNPNQITGTIEFSNRYLANPDPQVAEYLNQFYFNGGSWINANGVNSNLSVTANPSASTDNPYQLQYQLTVPTTDSGETYSVLPYTNLKGVSYRFFNTITEPVFPEPAADVQHDFQECAAIVDVKFVDVNGEPMTTSTKLSAFTDTPYRHGSVSQNIKSSTINHHGVNQLQLPVAADGTTYTIHSRYSSGTSWEVDRYNYECRSTITPACDTLVALTCQAAGAGDLGAITGVFDILGETEALSRSYVAATQGPFNNLRFSNIDTAGNYALNHLVPTAVENRQV